MKNNFLFSLTLSLSIFLFSATTVVATTYYVSPTGNDTNNGSQATPFKTISKCINAFTAGDSCILRGGTYPETVSINKQGTSANPITLKNFSGEKPIIDGQSIRETMTLTGANYIVIDGLTLINSNSYALYSENINYVTVKNCEVNVSKDGGLILRNGSNVVVDNCNVHNTNNSGTSASNEAVSFINVDGFEIKNSQVHDNGEEGIDAKYGARNGSIHHNKVYRNRGPNIYIDSASNIEVFNNEVYGATADKANIGLAVEHHANRYITENISIYNNIIRESPGGVSFWVEDTAASYAKFNNINIYHNLLYANTVRGAIRLDNSDTYSSNIKIKNNIFWNNSQSIDTLNTTDTDYNLFNNQAKGNHSLTVTNVGFINEASMNFHLNSNSPAIDKGIAVTVTRDFDDVARPQGAGFDLGPYEFQTGNPTYNDTDLEPDGDVDIFDFNTLVNNFGETGIDGWIRADIVKNGIVDLFDFNKLIENFGE